MIDLSNPDFKSTLKFTSMDNSEKDNIQYMTESELSVINFDSVKTAYANSLGLSEEVACSVDALMKKDGKLFFIEFKNTKIKGEAKRNVMNKVRDSILIYNDIEKSSISDTRSNAIFVLVYSEEKNSDGHGTNSIAHKVMSLAKEKEVRFGMERFKRLYFKEVYTYTEKEFEEFLED